MSGVISGDTLVENGFFQNPILNSPYEYPTRYWLTEKNTNRPTGEVAHGRRPSSLISPIPALTNKETSAQTELSFGEIEGYDTNYFINSIRNAVDEWRRLPESRWHVTPETARLLKHWRHYDFPTVRPFFCQIEAVETLIWLTEVAPSTSIGKNFISKLADFNLDANRALYRLAFKLATGAGKTTVMAMIIAWQTINAVRHGVSAKFTKAFLICAPGITIRDRLRVLLPNDTESYYKNRQIVPQDLLQLMEQARIVVTNYHAFGLRDTIDLSKGTRQMLTGPNGVILETKETPEQMLRRVMPELINFKSVLVINDEAHHCYAQRSDNSLFAGEDQKKQRDDKEERDRNTTAARVWFNGLTHLKRLIPETRVLDLSATPFFLKGSGYKEGTLFPWTVSDFSLMDALECGIVKLPRIPIKDSWTAQAKADVPVYRELWKHIGKELPRTSKAKGGNYNPSNLPGKLVTAIDLLYGSYEETFGLWEEKGITVPPCFIFVCQNTTISKLVYDYISGYEIEDEEGSVALKRAHCSLFSNYDDEGNRLAKPRTILIDSMQLESGEDLTDEFKKAAAKEIEAFKEELRTRTGDASAADKITPSDLLREVMNTVGKEGRLGGEVRCVVSVSMLTEGWDANNVTHILGVRAFGTQLLCEQVVGRGLRRMSYDLDPETNRFTPEYSEIFGVPFDFASQGTRIIDPPTPPEVLHVKSIHPERDAIQIYYPRVVAYYLNRNSTQQRIDCEFDDTSRMFITQNDVGPTQTLVSGMEQGGKLLQLQEGKIRPSEVISKLCECFIQRYYDAKDSKVGHLDKTMLYAKLRKPMIDWYNNYLQAAPGTSKEMIIGYEKLRIQACEKINAAIIKSSLKKNDAFIQAVIDDYLPTGSTNPINFRVSKNKYKLHETRADKNPINYAICDSNWEVMVCQILESHPRTYSYTRNMNLGFEVPYVHNGECRKYLPDFIVRIEVPEKGYVGKHCLNLVLEVKGYRYADADVKKYTMETLWVPGVNVLKRFGQWAFFELNREDVGLQLESDEWVDEHLLLPDLHIYQKFESAYAEKLEAVIEALPVLNENESVE